MTFAAEHAQMTGHQFVRAFWLLLLTCAAAVGSGQEADPQPSTPPQKTATAGKPRLPLPAESELKAASKAVRDAYAVHEADPQASSTQKYDEVLAAMRAAADKTNDPARKYALLLEAERMAVNAEEYTQAFATAHQRAEQFEIDPFTASIEVVELFAEPLVSEDQDALEYAIGFAEEALHDQRLEEAGRAGTAAAAIARAIGIRDRINMTEIRKKTRFKNLRFNDRPPATRATDKVAMLQKKITAAREAKMNYEAAVDALKKPSGAAADHEVAGRYECFIQGKWESGLRHLARGNTPELKQLAACEDELTSKESITSVADPMFKLAANWWSLASEKGVLTAAEQVAAKAHAASLYKDLTPLLTDAVDIALAGNRLVTAPCPQLLQATEADAARSRTASEAAQHYKMLLSKTDVSPETRKAAEVRLAHWESLAKEGKVRLGENWVTPEQRTEITKKADVMVQHSLELLRLGTYDLAREELRAASKLNPENFHADFLMGFVYTFEAGNFVMGAYHFSEAVHRSDAQNAFALNNLAVCQIFLGRYHDAAINFRRALELMPSDQTIADNVGTMLSMSRISHIIGLPDAVQSSLNDLYRTALHDLDLKPASKTDRFYLMSPYGKAGDPSENGGKDGLRGMLEEPPEAVIGIATGTGFVVAPGYVVTNNHVVEGGSELVIMDPKDHERHLPATVVATLSDPDIALLRCEQLDAPSLPLAAAMPRNGTDIMALGYPGGSLLGMEQKVTRGTVISQSDPQMDGGNFLHSATVNPGNSGGPIVNDQGHVVGVVVAIVRTTTIGNAYGVGIPVERIWSFIREHLADVQPADAGAPEKKWPDVGSEAGPSTVFISAKIKRFAKKKPADAPADAAPVPPPQAAEPTPPVVPPAPPDTPAAPDSPAPTDEN